MLGISRTARAWRLLLSSVAAGFALWASVSEGRSTRPESCRDLALLVATAALGAAMMIAFGPMLTGLGRPRLELTLASGAFLVHYLKRFGVLDCPSEPKHPKSSLAEDGWPSTTRDFVNNRWNALHTRALDGREQ
jgi:hypothetical protein